MNGTVSSAYFCAFLGQGPGAGSQSQSTCNGMRRPTSGYQAEAQPRNALELRFGKEYEEYARKRDGLAGTWISN